MRLRHPVVRGHPLHAIATDFPIALVPLALAASVAARGRRSPELRLGSDAIAALACGASVSTALLGWWDWLTIPSTHEARRPATIHGLVNTGATALVCAAAASRLRRSKALALAAGALVIGAWLGGDLVYRLGWRVRPAELYEQMEEGKSREEAERIIEEHERTDTFLAPR